MAAYKAFGWPFSAPRPLNGGSERNQRDIHHIERHDPATLVLSEKISIGTCRPLRPATWIMRLTFARKSKRSPTSLLGRVSSLIGTYFESSLNSSDL